MARTFEEGLVSAGEVAQRTLSSALQNAQPGSVVDAMRYATSGGKGLRAFLVLQSAALFDVSEEIAAPAAAAIEALHAYSLIHDDLPAMDDDDLRRGRPTVHVEWDDATAILAGDALQALAFELLGSLERPAQVRLDLITGLAKAAGVNGMVGGQALDIAAETAPNPLTLDQITRLQAGKTGALFEWSATAGAVMAGQDKTRLADFATSIGLAFQISDDILDVTGDEKKTGKRVQKDADAGKATFVSHLGLTGAQDEAHRLIERAKASLEIYGSAADPLCAAADFILNRDK